MVRKPKPWVLCRPEWEDAVSGAPTRAPRMTRKHEPCRDCSHMSVAQFLEHLMDLPWYAGQVSAFQSLVFGAARLIFEAQGELADVQSGSCR